MACKAAGIEPFVAAAQRHLIVERITPADFGHQSSVGFAETSVRRYAKGLTIGGHSRDADLRERHEGVVAEFVPRAD